MQFCPRCGAVLVQKTKNYGCADAIIPQKINTSEKIKEKTRVAVVSSKDTQTLPKIAETCKKCGHNETYFWTVQTRSGDESETKFFKCVKCEHTWREYR